MNKKPEISYSRVNREFYENGKTVSDARIKELWDDAGSADWTCGAYNEMVKRVMLPNKPPEECI